MCPEWAGWKPRQIPGCVAHVAPWLTATDIYQFANCVTTEVRENSVDDIPPRIEPELLRRLSWEFHRRAGTLTNDVHASLLCLQNPSYGVGVSHQPNFLANLNVAMQPVLANKLAQAIGAETGQIFTLLDYDSATDRRYRHALLPSPVLRYGYYSATPSPPPAARSLLMLGEPKPNQDSLKKMIVMIKQVSLHDAAFMGKYGLKSAVTSDNLRRGLERLEECLMEAWTLSSSLSELNAILMSKILNVWLGLPTIFVEGHRALRLMAEHFQYLWDHSRMIASASRGVAAILEEAGLSVRRGLVPDPLWVPFWGVCSRRHRFLLTWTSSRSLTAEGRCSECDSFMRIKRSYVRRATTSGRLIPKVVTDDLLDHIAWSNSAVCGYRGGREHYVFSAMVADRLGLKQLPTFLSGRVAAQGLQRIVCLPYRSLISELSRTNAAPQIAEQLLSAGRGSVAHWMLWNDGPNEANLAGMVRDFMAL